FIDLASGRLTAWEGYADLCTFLSCTSNFLTLRMWSDWRWFRTLPFFLNQFIPWNRCLTAIWEDHCGFTVVSYGYGWFLIVFLVEFFNFIFDTLLL
ncbi:MAG: hypothetical protein DI611_16005, partial [Brachybacterium faecium]